MNKIISSILIIFLMVSVVALPPTALASKFNFLVAESYNNLPTGSVPEGGIAAGTTRVKVTEEGKDKAVELSGSKAENGIAYTVETNENSVSVYFEIEFSKVRSKANFYVLDTDNKSFNIATVNEKGEIRSGDARLSSVMPTQRKVPVQLTYSKKEKKASIYVANKCLTSNRYMGSSAPKTIGGFGIKVTGVPEGSCVVDNFAIFEGISIINSSAVPKKPYSKEEIEVSSAAQEEEEFVGDSVFVNRSFDEADGRPPMESITVSLKKNRIDIAQSVFEDNKYIKIDKRGTNEGYISYPGSSSARFLVAQADYSTEMNTPSSKLLYVRDGKAASMFCTILNVNTSGKVTTQADSNYVCTIEPLKWVNIAVAMDLQKLIYDVYVDGKLVLEDIRFTNKTITAAPLIRTNCNATTGTGTLLVDNIKVYEGKEPRELEVVSGRKSVVTPTSVPISLFGNTIGVDQYGNNIYSNKTRSAAAHDIISENDDTIIYAHEDDLKTLFGNTVKPAGAHLEKASYYNVRETAIANGYLTSNMDTRLFLFSKTPMDYTSSELDEMRRHLFHDRPDVSQLKEMYEKTAKGQHPRILMTKTDLERIKSLYKTDPLMKEWGDRIITVANSWFGKADYKYKTQTTGGLDDTIGATSINNFMSIVMAYHLTGNNRYLLRAWKFLENICNLPDWDEKVTFLNVTELLFTAGLGYDWLYDYLTPEQRKFVEENAFNKGIELMRKVYYSELDQDEYYVTFYNAKNNWGAVTNGATMCGAMAFLDVYPEVCFDVIQNANRCIEMMTGTYYPTGAWEEGATYWNYALSYLTYSIICLRNNFGSDFGLSEIPALEKTGYYGSRLAGSTGMMTMGDTSGGFVNNRHIMYLAKLFGDSELMATRLTEMKQYGHKGTVWDMIYYDPALNQGGYTPQPDTYMPGMEVLCLREEWFKNTATYLGASGGDNTRNHGHMDTGSFVIDMAGTRFIHDVGGENYSAKGGYFTSNRYHFYAARPEGHNLYIINPEEDNLDYYGQKKNTIVKGELLVSKPKGSIGVMDMSAPYEQWANSAKRGFMLSDDRRSVTVRDEIDLKGDDNYIYWFLHTTANVEYLERNTAVLEKDGKKMNIVVDCDATDWSFELVPSKTMSNVTADVVKDTNKESQNYKTLAVKVEGASGPVSISAKFKQYDDLMIDPNPTTLPIDEWTIPDGEVTPLPTVDMLYADGQPIEDFDPEIGGYSSLVPNKTTKVPTITVDTDNYYEITQSTSFGTDTIIKVYSPKNANVYRTYRVNFYKLAALADIDGMRRYPVGEVTCIDTFEEVSPPNNVIDQNFGTRWASEGVDQWITLELDDVYPIEKVGISWMNGDSRVYNFKLEISENGQNWITVYNGASVSGRTGLEYTQVSGRKAKYVRYTGYGNSVNKWNSVTEIAVLGNQR